MDLAHPLLQAIASAKTPVPKKSVVEYDLSAVLVKAATIFERQLGNDWLLFAPDWPGWPVLLDTSIHDLLDQFKTPCSVGSVLARFAGGQAPLRGNVPDVSSLASVVSFFEESGFLRGTKAELPYERAAYSESFVPESVSVWLHITNACNLDCAYCFVRNKDGTVMRESVSDATADKLARTAVEHKLKRLVVKFAGGEPTLFLGLIERFRKRLEATLEGSGIRCDIAVLSNGTLVDEHLLAFLKQPHSAISISLDGYGDVHDFYRRTKAGTPTWTQIVKNIDLLQRHGIAPYIMATISERTRKALPNLVRWVLTRGLRMRLSVVREMQAAASSEYAIGMAQSFDDTFRLLETEHISFDPSSDLEICELHFYYPARGVPCGIGTSHLVIKPDGTLVGCPMNVHRPGEPPGNDLLATCRRIFPLDNIDGRSSSDSSECLSCRWFPVCAGGCPTYNEMARGYPFARSPLCGFYQAIIPRYLELFGGKLREHRIQT